MPSDFCGSRGYDDTDAESVAWALLDPMRPSRNQGVDNSSRAQHQNYSLDNWNGEGAAPPRSAQVNSGGQRRAPVPAEELLYDDDDFSAPRPSKFELA